MKGLNKVILIGTVGADPEVKYWPDGSCSTRLSVATNEVYKMNGEQVKETEWHHVYLGSNMAKIAGEYVKSGSKIYIEGRIKKVKQKDGSFYTKIIAKDMQMLGGSFTKTSEEPTFDEFDDEIPF